MSTDKVNSENNPKKDMDWADLIEHSNQEISACLDRIKTLRKSMKYFKKQLNAGIPFPLQKNAKHAIFLDTY